MCHKFKCRSRSHQCQDPVSLLLRFPSISIPCLSVLHHQFHVQTCSTCSSSRIVCKVQNSIIWTEFYQNCNVTVNIEESSSFFHTLHDLYALMSYSHCTRYRLQQCAAQLRSQTEQTNTHITKRSKFIVLRFRGVERLSLYSYAQRACTMPLHTRTTSNTPLVLHVISVLSKHTSITTYLKVHRLVLAYAYFCKYYAECSNHVLLGIRSIWWILTARIPDANFQAFAPFAL